MKMVRGYIHWTPLLPLLLLGLITLFAVRSLRGLLLWWGVPMLIAGGAGLGFGLAASLTYGAFVPPTLRGEFGAEMTQATIDAVLGLAGAFRDVLLSPVYWQSGMLALLGACMIGGAMILKTRQAVPQTESGATISLADAPSMMRP